MKTFSILIFIASSVFGFSQKAKIILKDKERKTIEIAANSPTQLYYKGGSVDYTEIDSIKFETERLGDRALYERLAIAGVKILIGDKEKIIDLNSLNTQPERGNKQIILICADSMEILYKRVGRHLSLKGYAIESSNKDFLSIKTALRQTSKQNFNYFLNIVVIDNTVNITAQLRQNSSIFAGTSESGFYDWEYTHNKQGLLIDNEFSILYNDLMENLSDFNRIRIRYK